ncbi:MAG: 2-oxoacid:acceptor oxidoreductase family protein [Thermodesulfobacteriota bacterium]|nr:2-oxoacid:acceptor oxidoreductase family protein [Thermodesulfobacteriota bacterium]
MFEIRFHGRGGQGAVVASIVLASAFFKEGKCVQAFPSFGAERRGAPVVAFTRISDQEIRERFGIYKPDCVIILDSSLTQRKDITSGLKEGHWIIINSDKKPEEYADLGPYRVATLDANSISLKYGLGSSAVPIVNTTILGAFSKVTQTVKIESVLHAVRENAPSKPENNANAAREAYDLVVF